jgi:glucokinase
MESEVTIGIDIGGTNTVFGLVSREGLCHGKSTVPTGDFPEVMDFVKAIHQGVGRLMQQNPGFSIKGIGIGAPNGNFYHGTIENAPNLRWKGFIPLADLFSNEFSFPVFLTNDANAAALGEMIYGGARQMRDFLLVTLGTGLGSGFVANGELIYGHDGFAGELGHILVEKHGRYCGCGRQGCLETYVSATGICRTVLEIMANSVESSPLRELPLSKISSRLVYEAALQGDPIALQSFEFTGEILGRALANAIAITSPEAIFLFGGLALSGDLIFTPTRLSMERNLLGIFQNKVKLLPSLLGENAAILGASALAWNELARR